MTVPDTDTSTHPIATRTTSIWLSQLLLAIVVVVVVLLVQSVSPETVDLWTFTVGVSLVVVLTGVALAVPWQRFPPVTVLSIPFLDILAVGIMTRETTVDFAFLWVFPVIWIATYFPLWATGIGLSGIGVMVLIEEAQREENAAGTLRLVVVTLSLTFIAISTHTASRQTRAFKRLLRREANRLSETLGRSKRQEREVSRVLGSVDVGVVRLSADGDIVEANLTYRELYDVAPLDPQLVARSVEYDDYQGRPLARADRPLVRSRAGEQFEDLRTWLFTADGSWRALSQTALRLPDDHDLAAGESLLVVHDITPMVSAERARDSLATRVSHELRNPLTTVLGYSDLVLEDESLDPKVRERIEAINSAAERMMRLANQILQSGRQARMTESAVTSTDLATVVAESVESLAPTALGAGVVVDFAPSEGVIVRGDAFRLRQVGDNLLSNAIKYTPKGGRVLVDVHVSETPTGQAGTSPPPSAVLRITDTGIGMEQDEVARVFEPYFRSAAAEQSTIVGTGLGMGIVQSLVTQHGGTVVVESSPGRGTTVTVQIPLDDSPAADEAGAFPPGLGAGASAEGGRRVS